MYSDLGWDIVSYFPIANAVCYWKTDAMLSNVTSTII